MDNHRRSGMPIHELLNDEVAEIQRQEPPQQLDVQRFAGYPVSYYYWNGVWHPDPRHETWEHESPEALRRNFMHQLVYDKILRGELHDSRLHEYNVAKPFRILGVGSTGRWELQMADKYPNAIVIAIDLVRPMSRENPPPNYFPMWPIDFNGQDWGGLQEASFDFLHFDMLYGRVTDRRRFFRKALWYPFRRKSLWLLLTCKRYLKPYTGETEFAEPDWEPRADPSSLSRPGQWVMRWWDMLREASERSGLPIAHRHDTRELLQAAGFVDIGHTEYRCPYWYGGDSQDIRTRDRWRDLMGSAIGESESTGANLYSTLAFPHFVKHLGYTEQDVIRMGRQVVEEVKTRATPLYHVVHVWTARRPSDMLLNGSLGG